MTKYNHMFSICFSLDNENEDGEATERELLAALNLRIAELIKEQSVVEACGCPDDTYVVEDS